MHSRSIFSPLQLHGVTLRSDKCLGGSHLPEGSQWPHHENAKALSTSFPLLNGDLQLSSYIPPGKEDSLTVCRHCFQALYTNNVAMDRGCHLPILMDVETQAELSVASRVHVLAESGGPQLVVLECREAGCHAHLLSWLPRGCQLCPHGSGRLSHESPPHTHTHRAVRSPQEGAELGPPVHFGQPRSSPGHLPMSERQEMP